MTKSVLIIEDEETLLNIVCAYFKKEGFTTYKATSGLEGLRIFNTTKLDAICVDIMLPEMNGWDLVKTIRKQSDIPIVMMTALSSDDDALRGYSLKVDDYVTKPFSPPILVAKVKNLIDRSHGMINKQKNRIDHGVLSVNLDSRELFINKQIVDLSKTEFDLLVYLIENKNIVLTRSQLLDAVWGFDSFVEERVVDTFIKTLRKKLDSHSQYIKTVFGVGYKYVWE